MVFILISSGIGQKYNKEELRMIATNSQVIGCDSITALASLTLRLQFQFAIGKTIFPLTPTSIFF